MTADTHDCRHNQEPALLTMQPGSPPLHQWPTNPETGRHIVAPTTLHMTDEGWNCILVHALAARTVTIIWDNAETTPMRQNQLRALYKRSTKTRPYEPA